MAHSLHSLVLDVCCENSQFYPTKEEALKVLYASVFTAFTRLLCPNCPMHNVFLFCNTTSVLHIIPSVLAKRGRDGVWHGFLLKSSHRRLVSFLSSLINSPLLQACLAEGKFFVCDQISPIPDGKLLLNYIRNVSFTSKSLPFNLADIVNPNLVFVTTQQSQYSEDCTRLCHRNTENNSPEQQFSFHLFTHLKNITFSSKLSWSAIKEESCWLPHHPPRPWKLLNRGL